MKLKRPPADWFICAIFDAAAAGRELRDRLNLGHRFDVALARLMDMGGDEE